jgi:hypothetical protein
MGSLVPLSFSGLHPQHISLYLLHQLPTHHRHIRYLILCKYGHGSYKACLFLLALTNAHSTPNLHLPSFRPTNICTNQNRY